jgi:hypothetical protein
VRSRLAARFEVVKRAGKAITLLALCGGMLSQAAAQGDPHTKGYPPLAVAYITMSSGQLTALRDTLKEFAKVERLEFTEGGFEKQGSAVQTFYLKQDDDAPVYMISNFMKPNRYQVIAYAGDDESAWQARWLKLLSMLRKQLGAGSVSDS